MQTPWQRAQIRRSISQERRFSKGGGAAPQINSGRFWHSKRDAKKYDFLVENRTTEKKETKSYSVKVDELQKLCEDAIFHQSLPAMNIEFPFHHQNWMLIRLQDFEAILEHMMQLDAMLERQTRVYPEIEETDGQD